MKLLLKTSLLLVVFTGLSLQAQVTNFSIFKVAVYYQSSVAPPTTPDFPNAYFFGAQLNSLDSSDYTNVQVTCPGIAGLQYLNTNNPNNLLYYNFGSPYFSDQLDFDNNYSSGEYDFEVDHADGSSDYGSLIVPDPDFYAPNIAAFTTNCWNAMQQVDPSQDFTLDWNCFTPLPVTTSAFIFVDVYDPNFNAIYNADFLPTNTMTTNIPAGTLQYGTTYRINDIFSSRQDTLDAGFGGALGTVGFDNQTYATLVTIPPWLRIASTNSTNVVLTWSATLATNFVLESAGQLTPDSVWSTITNVPNVCGTTNVLTLPANCPTRFFRLISADSL